MQFEFTGEVWFWRGPSPYHFVPLKDLVRNAEGIDVGDTVTVSLAVDV
ncbi:MAG: hypothetical protein JWO11_3025 [Nocardioides sp.]|nr:hypothetical protein [Nocardioides sp.]